VAQHCGNAQDLGKKGVTGILFLVGLCGQAAHRMIWEEISAAQHWPTCCASIASGAGNA